MNIKFGIISIILITSIVIANGQGSMQRLSPEERTKRVVDTITTVMKLDQAQQSSAQTAFLDYYKERDKLREAMQAGTPPEKSQVEKLTTERDEKLKKFLTSDQFKKFKEEIEPTINARRRGEGAI